MAGSLETVVMVYNDTGNILVVLVVVKKGKA